jgi:hypothetical protein
MSCNSYILRHLCIIYISGFVTLVTMTLTFCDNVHCVTLCQMALRLGTCKLYSVTLHMLCTWLHPYRAQSAQSFNYLHTSNGTRTTDRATTTAVIATHLLLRSPPAPHYLASLISRPRMSSTECTQ